MLPIHMAYLRFDSYNSSIKKIMTKKTYMFNHITSNKCE